jgi:hypothetical protein
MNTNSYLMVVAITIGTIIGVFILWLFTMVYDLLKAHVIPLYPHNIHKSRIDHSTDNLKKPIIRGGSFKKKPISFSDSQLWEKEQNERNHTTDLHTHN